MIGIFACAYVCVCVYWHTSIFVPNDIGKLFFFFFAESHEFDDSTKQQKFQYYKTNIHFNSFYMNNFNEKKNSLDIHIKTKKNLLIFNE